MAGDEDGVVEAARAIRPYLEALIGPAAAGDVDAAIVEAFAADADASAIASRLRLVLDADDDTAWFLAQVLHDAPDYRPPYEQLFISRGIGSAAPAGDPAPVAADRYICPAGDFVWYRPDLGTSIPPCPTAGHLQPLTRS
ncbi:hypothetical protein [Frankia gtarii]|uniref:hypothetical protein n=1 Tax=Frankia gtarii TaxID=2950102 RepID=UPI0021BFF6E0|nr:hypothetical protein [Frankia gtarii]